jgi:hypothetical protein
MLWVGFCPVAIANHNAPAEQLYFSITVCECNQIDITFHPFGYRNANQHIFSVPLIIGTDDCDTVIYKDTSDINEVLNCFEQFESQMVTSAAIAALSPEQIVLDAIVGKLCNKHFDEHHDNMIDAYNTGSNASYKAYSINDYNNIKQNLTAEYAWVLSGEFDPVAIDHFKTITGVSLAEIIKIVENAHTELYEMLVAYENPNRLLK